MLLKTLSNTHMQQTREWQQFGGYSGRESSITQNAEGSDHRNLYSFMKKRGKRRKQEGENEMGLLSYKIVRGTCLGFSEQLQVIVTCDVLQQRLTTAVMGLFVLLERVKQ